MVEASHDWLRASVRICHPQRADLPMSGLSATTRGAATRSDRLTESGSNHSPNLLALLASHEDWVETFGLDNRVGESVNRRRWVADDSLLIVGRQAVPELDA
jgi:hypothetical protein